MGQLKKGLWKGPFGAVVWWVSMSCCILGRLGCFVVLNGPGCSCRWWSFVGPYMSLLNGLLLDTFWATVKELAVG